MQTYHQFIEETDDSNRYGPDTHSVRLAIIEWLGKKDMNLLFDIHDFNIHTLVPLPPMKELRIGGPTLVYIPTLPNNLETLVCTDAPSLRKLPLLPNSVTTINISHTQIQELQVPPLIKIIIAESSSLTKLPYLYEGLEHLCINDTEISSLGVKSLPKSLRRLEANNTKITYLPKLGSNLHTLSISNTNISTLPRFPLSLRHLWLVNCKNLLLFPNSQHWLLTLEDIREYGLLWNEWHDKEEERRRIIRRLKTIKKELLLKTSSSRFFYFITN